MSTIQSELEAIENVQYVAPTDSTDKNGTWKILVNQAIGKAQKTPTSNKTTPIEESIDFAPVDETIDYEMNEMQHDYGLYPEFRDDLDVDNPLL